MNYTQIVYQDRVTIEIQLKRGCTQKEISVILGKNPGSISREIDRNSVKKQGSNKKIYSVKDAEIKAYQRRWRTKTQSMKINMNTKMKNFIINKLTDSEMHLSPKVIANMWNKKQTNKKKHITHTSIYTWLETGIGNKYKKYLLCKYKGYKKRKSQLEKVKIKKRIGIEQRPEIINNRDEQGHFEADLVVSKKGYKGAILTLIDRKTRLSRIFKLRNKNSDNVMNLISEIKDEIGIKSVTFDNGMEFAKHYLLNNIGIDTYFCNPYSSREKGSIENLNRIIRRFFPKGTIFDYVSEEKIKSICYMLANTPREILGFVSPNQAHFS